MKKSQRKIADVLFPLREEIEEFDVLTIPPEKRKLHTETYDFSVGTIYEYLKNQHIYIPSFQRGYVWTRSQASRLIESLIIQCPIPVLYLNQDYDEKLSVIDGNQRLQSIRLYLDNEFELKGLTAYPELEGMTFTDLDPRIKRHIVNRTLRCITILKETHPQIKFDVFERLNTGAVQLNSQELRHGIYHGKLINLVDELVEEPIWIELCGIKNDKRMKSSELILRFFAFYNDYRNYQKPLLGFINNFCGNNINPNNETLLNWKNTFLTTIEKVKFIFGEYAFRLISENKRPTKSINAALFDAQMVAVAYSNIEKRKISIAQKKIIIDKLALLLNEKDFNDSISSGTSATKSVIYRVERFQNFLKGFNL